MESEKKSAEVPKDAIVLDRILKSMGVKDYEPRVIEMLLELMYRYTQNILRESNVYSAHAGRRKLEVDDVSLAIRSITNHSYVDPPDVEYLLDIASEKNKDAFKLVGKPMVMLPPKKFCLSSANVSMKIGPPRKRKKVSGVNPLEPKPPLPTKK